MRKTVKCLAAAVLLSYGVYGQKNQVAAADKEYDKFAYVDAIKVYEKVFDRGYKSADMLKKLANAYYFQADYEKSCKWYGELFALPDAKESEYYYRYAQSLKATGNYAKADELLNAFYTMNNQDSRARLAAEQKNYLEIISKNSGRYTIGDSGINSDKSDYGSAFYGKKIVFASSRAKKGENSWDGQSYTDLYAADLLQDGSLDKPSKFGGRINTKYNESTPVFTKDGQTVYFTRNNYTDRKRGKDKNEITLLKLYKATKDGDDWKNIKELPFNSDNYNVAHPALSLDEKTLYFASDMPGSIGASDIYMVSINADDSYGIPMNLGPTVNTEGKETFPFISGENELYFASDGHPGLGGLDVFIAKPKKEGGFENPINVGEPVNSSSDDFAFLIDTKTKMGFFSSNRAAGVGNDDIYKLKEYKPIAEECTQNIYGRITDVSTGEPVSAAVILYDSKGVFVREVQTKADGLYDFGTVDCGSLYKVKTEKEGFDVAEKPVTTGMATGKTKADLTIKQQRAHLGDDLAKNLDIKIIYFDLDKSNIRPDAEVELSKVAEAMRQYPTIAIDVRSHTDCRNTAAYNMALSDRRAKSTIAWLVKQGISKKRLTGRGYGESQLLNDCGCEGTVKSNCTEEEHQKNRRSEFIIKKF
ncbi:OmpA family protein [Flavobacterium gilvum]|uniref:Flagellar motor protein MotB n=1 Tax=Flavobacterium gilvum TaxID=1492737 RepID=A0AAC9N577_9FLAO|nr:OmpA family protein [Flavobacterium gilvum]AOW09042.1 flagellar motor protein MotB [Flavobacterium gilvum]KFC60591.1 cell envelope biogenesis protein OmpA [Flavobacterium gilvum]